MHQLMETSETFTLSSSQTPTGPSISRGGTKKLMPVVDSVWDWVASCVAESPTQPVANLGLGLGQENPPDFLVEAHRNALEMVECNQYGPPNGLPQFKETLSRIYSPFYGRALDPDEDISIHSGGTEAILSAITAFVDPGDEVLTMEPAFDLYELHTRFVGGVITRVPLHPPPHANSRVSQANEWKLDLGELESAITPRTRMLVVNTPHNPLGKVFSAGELIAVGNICVKHGIIILSDEVYERLCYSPEFPRIATLTPEIARHTVTIGSIGKSFNATGWRVGYAIGAKELIREMQKAHIILSYTTAGPAQMAAAVGLEHAEHSPFWDKNRRDMKRKLEGLCEVFDELGLPYVAPAASHFLLVNIGSIKIPADYAFPARLSRKSHDWKLSYFLIREFGVAAIPASESFSEANTNVSHDYLRFVTWKNDDELNLAKSRLKGLKAFL